MEPSYVDTRQGEGSLGNSVNISRSLSVRSSKAVDTVGKLRQKLGELEGRVHRANEVYSCLQATKEELVRAKLDLAQIVGTLDKFQFDEVDAVVTHDLDSGRDQVRQGRKDLTRAVTALRDEAMRRHGTISARIDRMSSL